MERLKSMKESLMSCVQSQMGDLKNVDAKELGEAVDMIKDLAEAIYYCSITKAMEENDKKEKIMYYTPRYMPYYDDRDMDRKSGKMYYGGGNQSSGGNQSGNSGNMSGSRNYTDNGYYMDKYLEGYEYPPMHDYREGKSHINRRNYMEGKEMHKDKKTQMNELERYMQELSMDITEMIEDASPEEKQLLKQKLETLNDKIK